jgi:flavodoxin
MNKKFQIRIRGKIDNKDSYDVIYIGYPNWWGKMPMILFIFLESYDFSRETIVSFCTHEGSGMRKSENDIRPLYPKPSILWGLAIVESNESKTDNYIANWLKNLIQTSNKKNKKSTIITIILPWWSATVLTY